MFLTPAEIAHLTGIKTGRNGKTREQLQIEQLRVMGVAFRINARGAPVVTWSAVDGVSKETQPQQWVPAALRAAA
jgi:hypothetical protein